MREFDQDVIDAAMLEACQLATNSLDRSSQTGAVILSPTGHTIGRGYNAFMPGFDDADPANHERPRKYQITEHAERRAIFDATRRSEQLLRSVMVAAWVGCTDCDRAIAQSGIGEIIRLPLRGNDHWLADILVGDEILRRSGVKITEMTFDNLDLPRVLRNGVLIDPREP